MPTITGDGPVLKPEAVDTTQVSQVGGNIPSLEPSALWVHIRKLESGDEARNETK